MIQNLAKALKDEAVDARDNRHYGPLMGIVVCAFWLAAVVALVKSVDCGPSAYEQQRKAEGWR
jgi:lipopolysaccharide/colanic/teichoic acid biosynthesis glycosyltransferase